MVMETQITNIIIRPDKPVVHKIPAASEAMIVAKGLIVEHREPTINPQKTEARPTRHHILLP